MIEIWLQTFALIALAYAVTTLVFRPRHLEKQGLKWGLNSAARWLALRPSFRPELRWRMADCLWGSSVVTAS